DPAWHETDRLPPSSPASSVASFPSAATRESRPAIRGKLQNQNCNLPSPQASKACNLKTYLVRKIDSRSMPWQLFTDDSIASHLRAGDRSCRQIRQGRPSEQRPTRSVRLSTSRRSFGAVPREGR